MLSKYELVTPLLMPTFYGYSGCLVDPSADGAHRQRLAMACVDLEGWSGQIRSQVRST
jgi:hypothetical protein